MGIEFSPPRCTEHPAAGALERCGSCARSMCVECFRFMVDGVPWCSGCVAVVSRRDDRFPLAFAVANLAVGFAFALALLRAAHLHLTWLFGAGTPLGLALVELARIRRGDPPLTRREIVEVAPGATPKRAKRTKRLRRATRRFLRGVVPSWSARTTVLVVVTSFLLTALIVPKALALPHFVELELVLAAWWAILWLTLGVLLYRGARLADDHVLSVQAPNFGKLSRKGGDAVNIALDTAGCLDLDFVAVAVTVVVLVFVAAMASWLVVELVFPALFFVVYVLLRRALARVTNDEHGCAGSLPRSAAWALVWSLVYAAPLALASYAVHFALLHA